MRPKIRIFDYAVFHDFKPEMLCTYSMLANSFGFSQTYQLDSRIIKHDLRPRITASRLSPRIGRFACLSVFTEHCV